MTNKYIYLEAGDTVPKRTVTLVFRFAKMDNGTVAIQCQGTNELNAWNTVLSLHENGGVRLSTDLPHGLFEERHGP